MDKKLLTIAIPTYNRSSYLDTCLMHIIQQLCGYESLIEIIVSDNCSTDNTSEIAKSYINDDINIRYVKNNDNIGADKNFLQCFSLSKGKYVLVFGDDDILLDGALAKIITILQEGEYGVVYLNSYGFKKDYLEEAPVTRKNDVIYCKTTEEFLKKVNYWITFASGNICNKSLLPHDFDPGKYVNTNLVQVYWYLSSIFAAKQNIYVPEYLVAAKDANSGGYNFSKVFGINLNVILKDSLSGDDLPEITKFINNTMIRSFFPSLIVQSRRQLPGHSFEKHNFIKELLPIYRGYMNFWIYIVPIAILPKPLMFLYHILTRILNLTVVTFNKIFKQF